MNNKTQAGEKQGTAAAKGAPKSNLFSVSFEKTKMSKLWNARVNIEPTALLLHLKLVLSHCGYPELTPRAGTGGMQTAWEKK